MADNGSHSDFEQLFGPDGDLGGELQPVLDAEALFEDWVRESYQLRNRIAHALLGFCVATFHLAVQRFREEPRGDQQALFKGIVAWYVGQFKRLRGAEVAFHAGYGMCAASLLRDVRDWTYTVSALQNGAVTWDEIHGGPMGAFAAVDEERERVRHRNRMRASRRVKEWAIGKDSGLQRWEALKDWDRMMNYETHGAVITTVIEGAAWLDGRGDLPLGPAQDPYNQRLYVSRSLEIGHLVLRLLPLLQVNRPFGNGWNERWHCLDGMLADNWTSDERTARYMPAFYELLTTKYPFAPEMTRLEIRVEPGGSPPVLDH